MSTVPASSGVTYSAEAAGNDGNLRCDVVRRHIAYDSHAQYSIVISNETNADAHALAFVPETLDQNYRTIARMEIGPFLNFSTAVELELAPSGRLPEIRVALTTGATEFTLAVPSVPVERALPSSASTDVAIVQPATPRGTMLGPVPPVLIDSYAPPYYPVRATRPRTSPRMMPSVFIFITLVLSAAIFFARPNIAALDVPTSVWAGTQVAISYRATGLGAAAYSVLGPDGQTLTAGPLALGSGMFLFSAPKVRTARTYLMRLRITSLLGSAIDEAYVPVRVPPAPHLLPHAATAIIAPLAAPQIRSLALDRATVASGETLNVYYDVLATSGTVALADPAARIIYGSFPLTSVGHATFVAPRTDIARSLSVIVTAWRGTATTESRIGVSLSPPSTSDVQTNATGADANAQTPGVDDASPTEIFAPPAVVSRQPFRVEVHGSASDLQVILLDGDGGEVARRDVRGVQKSVELMAPSVAVATRFLIEATYTRGAGSESVMRAITIKP